MISKQNHASAQMQSDPPSNKITFMFGFPELGNVETWNIIPLHGLSVSALDLKAYRVITERHTKSSKTKNRDTKDCCNY